MVVKLNSIESVEQKNTDYFEKLSKNKGTSDNAKNFMNDYYNFKREVNQEITIG